MDVEKHLDAAADHLSWLTKAPFADIVDLRPRANLARYKCPHCHHVTGWTAIAGVDATCGNCGGEFRTVSP